MIPSESLARGAAFLDEATENLTFDAFDWAFEELWRGLAWVLNAASAPPRASLERLGPKGEIPPGGTLNALLSGITNPEIATLGGAARLVARMEKLRAKLGGAPDLQAALAASSAQVAAFVFAAWEVHDACGRHLGLVDERLADKLVLTEVSPGKVGSQLMQRRTALKLLAAASILPLQACLKVERDNRAPSKSQPANAGAPQPARAGLKAVTPINAMHWETEDPFLFCAHHDDKFPAGNAQLGPDVSLAGRHLGRDFNEANEFRMYHGRVVPGFPRHPHRGFETVTVVRTGMLDHADSMGATARYGAGDVQWLTAGGGIQHAEMFPLLKSSAPNPLELFQIWVNLPRADKMVDPYFTMLWSETIPRVIARDGAGKSVELTVIAGRYGSHQPPPAPPNSWASRPDSDLAIWALRLEPGAAFELPAVAEDTRRSLYVHQGAGLQIADAQVPNKSRAQVDGPGALQLRNGPAETEILLLQGRPIGEPVAKRGPFVMNSQQEIRQAYADYQRTQFGGWPWPENDPVHPRDKGRFARHVDGRFEQPT